MLKIRQFSLSDLPKVIEIEKTSLFHSHPETYLKKLYKKHPNDFLVVEAKLNSKTADLAGKVVGYILGYVKPDKSGSIETLAVDPNYRRRGIGKELINFIIQRLKEKSVKEVFLHARRKNQTAISFYKKLGFKIIKIVKKYYRNGDDALLMKKDLGA